LNKFPACAGQNQVPTSDLTESKPPTDCGTDTAAVPGLFGFGTARDKVARSSGPSVKRADGAKHQTSFRAREDCPRTRQARAKIA